MNKCIGHSGLWSLSRELRSRQPLLLQLLLSHQLELTGLHRLDHDVVLLSAEQAQSLWKSAIGEAKGGLRLSSWLGHCQKLSTQQCCTTMEAITAAMRRHSEDARVLEVGSVWPKAGMEAEH